MRFLLAFLLMSMSAFAADSRVALTLDTSEAESVLSILDKHAAKQPVSDSDWNRLFATEPYKRLKQRESAMHRTFTDADFQKFVLSGDLLGKRNSLRETLERWKRKDLNAAGQRVLSYLPAVAVIRAKVFPTIKPMTNSFVWEPDTNAAIFLYLDPEMSAAVFENTVAHELHHIGFASVKRESEKASEKLAPNVKTTVDWMGGFGEGMAMLAAAGTPDVHPHENSKAETRARWDRDMANFNRDLKSVEQFFFNILDGRFKTEEEENKAGFQFFGEQGPWYTVGYKMSATVERRFGREKLIESMLDYRKLLTLYNQAAQEENARGGNMTLWSPELIQRVSDAAH